MASPFRHGMIAIFQGQQMFSLSRHLATLSLYQKYAAFSLSTSPHSLAKRPQQVSIDTHNAREISTSSSRSSASAGVASSDSTDDLSKDQNISQPFDPVLVDSLFNNMDGDFPVSDMPDPFVKDYRRCFLCKQNVKLDHKNVRLLSQFVSPYTGRIYGRAVTGLCIPMQRHVAKLIKRSRNSGYMPFILKDSRYLQDPQPFDPMAKRKVQ